MFIGKSGVIKDMFINKNGNLYEEVIMRKYD